MIINLLVPAATVNAARPGRFEPISTADCQSLREIAGKTLGVAFKLEPDAPFTDLRSNEEGRGCTLTATGTGRDFPDLPGELAKKLMNAFKGWTEVTDADVYAGFGSDGGYAAMTREAKLMVIHIGWNPTPEAQAEAEAKCPGEPVSSCGSIKPEQKLYTIEICVAQH